MNKVKVGDKVRLVNKPVWVGAYQEGDTGVVVDRDSYGNACVREDHVLILLDKGCNQFYTVHENEIQVVNTAGAFNNLKPSAEEVRENILSLRSERERHKVAISDIDKQESEMLELLKEMGFVLHDLPVKSSGKTVLYAEDIEEDMSDPNNWKVGDVLEQTYYAFKDKYTKITEIKDGRWFTQDKDGDSSWGAYSEMLANFKFHSRPVNS